ncbi:hypothetical protein RUM43_008109 [Polyplax serrata]
MSTYKKIGPTYILKNNKRSLENLVRHYLAKTDELEDKEGKVLRQMEVMQSAVTSLQGWNQKRMSQQLPQAQPVIMSISKVEEETRKIREETARIQNEIRDKIEANKKLQEEVNKRKLLQKIQKEAMEREETPSGERTPEEFSVALNREKERKKFIQEIRDSDVPPSAPLYTEEDDDDDSILEEDPAFAHDPRVKFFQDKIRKLKEMERRLMKESEEDARVSKAKREKLLEKIEMLEWESEIDRQLIKSLKRKYQ